MVVNCSLLENILFDYDNGDLPLDPQRWFTDGLNWEEHTKLIYWWNQAVKDGVNSIAHLKLCYTVQEIIEAHKGSCGFDNYPVGRWNIN